MAYVTPENPSQLQTGDIIFVDSSDGLVSGSDALGYTLYGGYTFAAHGRVPRVDECRSAVKKMATVTDTPKPPTPRPILPPAAPLRERKKLLARKRRQ